MTSSYPPSSVAWWPGRGFGGVQAIQGSDQKPVQANTLFEYSDAEPNLQQRSAFGLGGSECFN